MSGLESVIPVPRRVEVDEVIVGASAWQVWSAIRHGDLAGSPLLRALFWLRTLPDRVAGKPSEELSFRIDDLRSSAAHPGFQVLLEQAPYELVVGAIGKVWEPKIPFVHVADAAAYAHFQEPDFVKVAWALRVEPHGHDAAQVTFELRVSPTDEAVWPKFERYFAIIGPASHFIRRTLLARLVRTLGTPEARESERRLPGDELLLDAADGLTHGITIRATPEEIWPWLVQMGCGRAGFYSYDWLDNHGVRSARDLHWEWSTLKEGEIVPTGPDSAEGFEVLRLDAPRTLVLGGLYDTTEGRQLRFAEPRPARYWQVTWAFVLEPIDSGSTRLLVRARAAFPSGERGLRASSIRFVHHFMERAQLRHLAARVERRLPLSEASDVLQGVGGAALIAAALLTPFLRARREHWGVPSDDLGRTYPGDGLVRTPRWSWAHAVEIAAPRALVWPWIAQIGADRGGFYSYQWLENLVGCALSNAETVHPEWEITLGAELRLHPRMPGLRVVALERERYFVAHGPADPAARLAHAPWAEVSWAFVLESLEGGRCRLTSRYRAACSDDLATRLSLGPALLEPVSFAMDRRMLLGIKERVERASKHG